MTWGGIVSIKGQLYVIMLPHLVLWPGIFLAIVVCINRQGDAFTYLTNPRLRRAGTI
jgi:ABC-type dipeptide/oligopeptide/nickel transport system permease subunit